MFAKPHHRARLQGILAAVLLVSFLLSGCSALAKAEPTATATTVPTAAPTQTSTLAPTNTPVPTSTAMQTPMPTATATLNATATAAAVQAATEQALADLVKPELVKYGINPEDGHVAYFMKSEIRLEISSYNEEKFSRLDEVGNLSDFVMGTKVTWNSTGGIAGCGINFRAEKDMTDGAHYAFLMMRLQFQPYWDVEYHKFNRWEATVTNTGKPLGTSDLNDDKNSTNLIGLVVSGKEFTPYFNGEKQSTASSTKLSDGNIILVAWHDSGKTSCKFSNTWVWVPDKK